MRSAATGTAATSLNLGLLGIRNLAWRSRMINLVSVAVAALNAGHCDYVVLAARRMSCVYKLLLDEGIVTSDWRILSDRFMEMQDVANGDHSFWLGKRVVLIDDSVYSGTTLRDRVERLEKLLGESGSLEIHVAFQVGDIDLDVQALVAADPPISLSGSETAELNRQYARMFGMSLTPYFTDFPVSKLESISVEHFDEIVSNPNWISVDVTNSTISGTGFRSYTLFPAGDFLEELGRVFGPLKGLFDICKLRIFVADDSPTTVRFRVVPIVSLASIDRNVVRTILAGLGLTSAPNWTDHQVVGLISYTFARLLMKAFRDQLKSQISPFILIELDSHASSVDLGGSLFERLDKAIRTWSVSSFLPLLDGRSILDSEPNLTWQGKALAKVASPHFVVGDDLVEPLFKILTELRPAPSDRSFRWVDHSITLSELSDRLQADFATVSLEVDVLNDLGFAVPTNYLVGEKIQRAYRPGEAAFDQALVAGALGGRLAAVLQTICFDLDSDSTAPVLSLS
jgi:hypothetical protein